MGWVGPSFGGVWLGGLGVGLVSHREYSWSTLSLEIERKGSNPHGMSECSAALQGEERAERGGAWRSKQAPMAERARGHGEQHDGLAGRHDQLRWPRGWGRAAPATSRVRRDWPRFSRGWSEPTGLGGAEGPASSFTSRFACSEEAVQGYADDALVLGAAHITSIHAGMCSGAVEWRGAAAALARCTSTAVRG